ncbi:unnamed protein product [Cylindrotheca closterium]|uniref:Uncharacterized protein n=1 Tax=Cylindrotheca closterium TaxID=2856 RepID=A0AAD2JKY8_9STRA|nr:unnamed protein product [Cylindrotheca closterium]
MEHLQQSPQDAKTEQSRPTVGYTTSDFPVDAVKPRTRFNLSDKRPVDFPRKKNGSQRQRNGLRLEDEAKLEGEQPSSWLCFAPDMTSSGERTAPAAVASQQQKAAERFSKRNVRRGKDSASIPQSNLLFDDNTAGDDYNISDDDDMSGIVSALTTKTPVAGNRGKKLDLFQPIYDRMGIYSKKDKEGLRDAIADLLFIVR